MDPVRKEYARLAERYDRRWSDYIRATVEQTMHRTIIRPGDRILDVGCGTGVLIESVIQSTPGVKLVGLDLCHDMLRVAKRRASSGVTLVTANAESLPFRSGSFDVVVSNSSFHYWAGPEQGLAEIHRVLAPHGRFVITDWCGDYLTCKACELVLRLLKKANNRVYGLSGCQALAEDAGFRVTGADRYKINWLWGLMTLSAIKAAI